MLAVIICGLINSGLLLGLLAGIGVGFVRARTRIAAAMASDLVPLAFIPASARPSRA